MILLSLLLFTTSPSLETAPLSSSTSSNFNQYVEPVVHSLFDSPLYLGAATVFGSATLLTRASWAICQFSPWTSTIGNECLISSRIFKTATIHSFAQVLKKSPLFSFIFKKMPSSYSSWDLNKKMLAQIPTSSLEDKELLDFLQNRWLAKMTGCYPFLIDWMCPSFGISLQVHPETTNSYARDPATKLFQTYKNRVEAWKQHLPQPHHFHLILTRPYNIRDYLPLYLEVPQGEIIQCSVERMALAMGKADFPLVVDLTSVLPNATLDPNEWLSAWTSYENQLSQYCSEHQLDPNQLICIQRVQQKEIGGIRLLPLASLSKENIENQYQFLLEWISRFGLTANRVELDRLFLFGNTSFPEQNPAIANSTKLESKDQLISFLNSVDQSWKSNHPQKTLMFKGTLQVLKNLCAIVPQEKWEEIMNSATRSSAVQLGFTQIKQQLQNILQENEKVTFQEMVSHVEQIHAALTSLIEIFRPYAAQDYCDIFRQHLTCIPKALQPLTGYAIHSSAMTSLGGIFKTVEKMVGKPPRILYGENTYFECIHAAERISKALSFQEATMQDWKEVDLILVQFNPTVKRINFKVTEYQATEYHVEKIADVLHHALKVRGEKPLSVALDCTLDFSDSSKVGRLLAEFQDEIETGQLNIMCYRSGLKFDLFGMDNYCGAPFFMVHNNDPKWSFFEPLLTDPVLLTDHLSLNWFCLAFQHATPYLEMYRKQIFENTRAVLNKIPAKLFDKSNQYYRVIPMDPEVDPSFIDIKIFGPLHAFRGGLLVGAFLTMKCMEAGYPLLYRPGIGFYHPNLAVLFGTACTTVRLTVGLDPAQVDVIARCLEQINASNTKRDK